RGRRAQRRGVEADVRLTGKCSWFGGPLDRGVAPDEGLAFISHVSEAPLLFLVEQPAGTTGLARRLNSQINYIACRWDYDETPKKMLLRQLAMVRAHRTGNVILCFPADWGPHEDTGRVADVSLGAMRRLGILTDDVVDVSFPATDGLIA